MRDKKHFFRYSSETTEEDGMSARKYFGTDGVRGCVNGPFINTAWIEKFGWAVGTVVYAASNDKSVRKPFVLIGQDSRESGQALEAALQKGLTGAGVDVVSLGILPTPAIAFLTKHLQADASIVISASHNPYSDNGVKVIGKNGFKFPDAWELAVEKKIDAVMISVPKVQCGECRTLENAASDYITNCKTIFGEPLKLAQYKLLIDCANGATSFIAPILFRELQASIVAIHAAPNGRNINDHCGATNVSSLRDTVLAEKADCGIAFDGDGDRLIMVDHLGEIVDGDEILGVLAMHDARCKAVVGTLMSNLGLEKALQARNIQFERVAVGDRYVLTKLQEKNWYLGGEGSGHIVNLNYATTGDGIITALQVLRIMQQTKKSLHELKQAIQKRPQVLINVPVKDPQSFSSTPGIIDAVKRAEKTLNNAGRVLLRASGTESCVRVMVEADSEIVARELAELLAKTVTL